MREKTQIDLSKFCSKADEPREMLRAPWEHKGYRYASNGHICVRVPAPDAKDTVCEHKIAEKAVVLFANCDHTEYAPLSEFDPGEVCRQCGGKGQYPQVTCADCDGKGYFEHGQHGYEYDCQNCDTLGKHYDAEGTVQDCPMCNGYGHKNWSVPVGQAAYAAMYLSLIKQLPNMRFSPGEPANGSAGGQMPGHFVFTGGEGLLMPRMTDEQWNKRHTWGATP